MMPKVPNNGHVSAINDLYDLYDLMIFYSTVIHLIENTPFLGLIFETSEET